MMMMRMDKASEAESRSLMLSFSGCVITLIFLIVGSIELCTLETIELGKFQILTNLNSDSMI